MNVLLQIFVKLLFLVLCTFNIAIAEVVEKEIVIQDHIFYPQILEVPAGKKIRLIIQNNDKSVEEFESIDLKREKIVPGNSSVKIILPPLTPGDYFFFGDFNQDTARGTLRVVKE